MRGNRRFDQIGKELGDPAMRALLVFSISRLYPTTSAAKIAASLRLTRPSSSGMRRSLMRTPKQAP